MADVVRVNRQRLSTLSLLLPLLLWWLFVLRFECSQLSNVWLRGYAQVMTRGRHHAERHLERAERATVRCTARGLLVVSGFGVFCTCLQAFLVSGDDIKSSIACPVVNSVSVTDVWPCLRRARLQEGGKSARLETRFVRRFRERPRSGLRQRFITSQFVWSGIDRRVLLLVEINRQ